MGIGAGGIGEPHRAPRLHGVLEIRAKHHLGKMLQLGIPVNRRADLLPASLLQGSIPVFLPSLLVKTHFQRLSPNGYKQFILSCGSGHVQHHDRLPPQRPALLQIRNHLGILHQALLLQKMLVAMERVQHLKLRARKSSAVRRQGSGQGIPSHSSHQLHDSRSTGKGLCPELSCRGTILQHAADHQLPLDRIETLATVAEQLPGVLEPILQGDHLHAQRRAGSSKQLLHGHGFVIAAHHQRAATLRLRRRYGQLQRMVSRLDICCVKDCAHLRAFRPDAPDRRNRNRIAPW